MRREVVEPAKREPAASDGLHAPAVPSMLARWLEEQRNARFFCGMGVCLECEVDVDGRVVRLCLEPSQP